MSFRFFKRYVFNIAIAVDQLVNSVCNGHPDETLSSRCYRLSERYWYAHAARVVLDFLFRPWGANHCYEAYQSELKRSHLFATAQELKQSYANYIHNSGFNTDK